MLYEFALRLFCAGRRTRASILTVVSAPTPLKRLPMLDHQTRRLRRDSANSSKGPAHGAGVAMLFVLAGLAALLAVGLAGHNQSRAAESRDPSSAPRRLKVLFLGDNGHHRPLDRCRQVFSDMARR